MNSTLLHCLFEFRNFCKQRFGKTPATLRKHWGLSTEIIDFIDFIE